jgi:hypothetical protein
LNEGVGLPHARIDELDAPKIVLGLTRAGVLDAPIDAPVEVASCCSVEIPLRIRRQHQVQGNCTQVKFAVLVGTLA